ncbi:stage III sporulation protein AF [Virgibacillus proomii]|uniref:stage III sporulation protein AF n=1 Tax=Virgibacillus proomii TaxID=84407 RepID=UPI002816204B|nr:stage III sporulation protein AF [Virgibacillus proomii]
MINLEIVIQWVTQIIIFILLATVIDLLIPATALKKYIKLVVGFILILILLKPIFFLFQIDVQHALEASISKLDRNSQQVESMENLIESQKNEIEGTQDAYILEQMAVQLKQIAKEPLKKKFQTEIKHIEFRFTHEGENTFENLDEVIVYLTESNNDGEGAVRVVDDVVIYSDSPNTSKEDKKLQEIEAVLNEVWEMDKKKLILQWEGGPS